MKIDPDWKLIVAKIIAALLIAYSLTTFNIPFGNTFCLLTALVILFESFFPRKTLIPPAPELQVSDLQKFEELLQEKDEVIVSYETMLDEQVVSIPCNCGSTLFKGILIPNAENLCKCSKCSETYKVFVSYDSILIAEPLTSEAVFDNIKSIVPESID